MCEMGNGTALRIFLKLATPMLLCAIFNNIIDLASLFRWLWIKPRLSQASFENLVLIR